MKRIITLAFILCLTSQVFAQTDGLTYQAVIINPSATDLPGVDSPDNFLPSTSIAIRFSIIDGDNEQNPAEFQEIVFTETDEFGRVNVVIGKDNDAFRTINWDGQTKLLKVEIDFDAGNDFSLISVEELTFLPYASHRDITASGTLTVDGNAFINGELQVQNPAIIDSSLDVINENPTNLTGTLTVGGETNINDAFSVLGNNPTDLTGSLRVGGNSDLQGTLDLLGAARFENDLNVQGNTTLNNLTVNGLASFGNLVADSLTVNFKTRLNGETIIDGMGQQVKIQSNMTTFEGGYARRYNHPLLIEGGINGLAIVVSESRSNNTNFITFYDKERDAPWGRIEGETPGEFENNADYLFDQRTLNYDIFDADLDFAWATVDIAVTAARLIAAGSDFRACFGLGACTVVPGPVDIAFAAAEVIIVVVKEGFAIAAKVRAGNNKDIYDANKIEYEGVTYASGAGDYAEYLERANIKESMTYGDVVGVIGGKISKNTANAERVMVVSYKPIVLGNMPETSKEANYEKVAFMGQIPVKVFGKVNIGDYIIPSGKNDGIAKAMSPSKLKSEHVRDIIGISWEESNVAYGFNMVNVAVGLNKNDNNFIVQRLEKQVQNQDQQIAELKTQITKIFEMLSEIKQSQVLETSDYSDEKKGNIAGRNYERVSTHEGEIIYFEITDKDFELALKIAENQLRAEGADIDNFELWKKLKSDPNYKNEFFQKLKEKFNKQFHYHRDLSTSKRD